MFDSHKEITYSLCMPILEEVEELMKGARFKNYFCQIVRHMGLKEPYSNDMISSLDLYKEDNKTSIQLITDRRPKGINLMSCDIAYIRKFIFMAAFALVLYKGSSILYVTNLDEILGIVEMRSFLATMVNTDTNKYKSQIIFTLSDANKLEQILKTLSSKPETQKLSLQQPLLTMRT